jgi:CRP/FNR family transcriptional regulator
VHSAITRHRPRCDTCAARRQSLCQYLPEPTLNAANDIIDEYRLADGAALYQDGERADALYVVSSGCLRSVKTLPDARRMVTGFQSVGDHVGISLDGLYSNTTEAVGESRVCKFDVGFLRSLMAQHPEVENEMLKVAARELGRLQQQLLTLGRKTPVEKVATMICRFLESGFSKGPDTIVLPMSRTDIADYLGLTIETISRSFTRLREDGVIDMPRVDQIVVVDRAALSEIAKI